VIAAGNARREEWEYLMRAVERLRELAAANPGKIGAQLLQIAGELADEADVLKAELGTLAAARASKSKA
jgi:hypothetical protein